MSWQTPSRWSKSSRISRTNDDKSPPPLSSSGRLAVSPITAGLSGNHLAPNGQSRVRVRDIHPGSWVLLLDQRGRSSNDDEDIFLRYSFVRIRRTSAEIATEQQQQRPVPVPVPNLVEVVGGLTEFLRETVPGIDISTYEKWVEETEKDLRERWASIETGNAASALASWLRAVPGHCLASSCDIPVLTIPAHFNIEIIITKRVSFY